MNSFLKNDLIKDSVILVKRDEMSNKLKIVLADNYWSRDEGEKT